MNHLVSMIHLDAGRLILFGIGAFLAFALGYWLLSAIIRNWHPAFQIAGLAGFYLVPLSAPDQTTALMYGQVCVGLTAHRAFEWYRRIMYRRGFPLI